MTKHDAIILRANLLQITKGLDLIRRGVFAVISDLEKTYQIETEKGNGNGKQKAIAGSIEDESGENSPESNQEHL